MWSSCGFNMALFREYLSAVVSSLMDRNWLSFCLLHKKELCRFPGPRRALLLPAQNPALFSSLLYAPLLACPPAPDMHGKAWILCQLWNSRHWEMGFTFQSSLVLRRGETSKICCSTAAFFPPDRREIWSLTEKRELSKCREEQTQ